MKNLLSRLSTSVLALVLGLALSFTGLAKSSSTTAVSIDIKRSHYFPMTEKLRPDEMRVISCGTGMPNQRKSQAAACWLVQLGNGENFLFDIGTGSAENLAVLGIPYNKLNKIFLSHLHSDHWGDFVAIFIGGWIAGRTVPLQVWGPSGQSPKFGTKYAVDHVIKAFHWDISGRKGRLPATGGQVQVHQFDYTKPQIVYQKNGVTIRVWPAIHAIDGPVSYSLEWKGLKFVFSGDTVPNKWFLKYGKNADILIHETFLTIPQLIEKMRFNPKTAAVVGTRIHTPPEAAGKIFSILKPRMAVSYHFFNDFNTRYDIYARVRSTYQGPLVLAKDMLVFNITKENIQVREIVAPAAVWPPAAGKAAEPPDPTIRIDPSKFIKSGEINIEKLVADIIQKLPKKYRDEIQKNGKK